jgi:hypothetical protein
MFKVQGSKLELKMKGCYRLLLTSYRLPIPFTIYDLNDFNGFNPPASPERSRWRAGALNYLTNLPDNISRKKGPRDLRL